MGVNALVGGMVGQERTVLPLLAGEVFGLASFTATLTFIAAFGLTKAVTNFFAGTLADRYGRKPVLVAGWLVGVPVPVLLLWASAWEWVVFANVLLGVNQGLAWSVTGAAGPGEKDPTGPGPSTLAIRAPRRDRGSGTTGPPPRARAGVARRTERAVNAMRHRMLVRQPLGADLPAVDAAFTADPGAWLPAPARSRGPGCWTVGLSAGPATRSVACRLGGVWRTGHGTWRSVQWHPGAEPDDLAPVSHGLPTFRGEIGLVDREGRPELVLRGSYRPPGGWLGGLADVTALRRLAATTGRRFLEDVGDRLCERTGMGQRDP